MGSNLGTCVFNVKYPTTGPSLRHIIPNAFYCIIVTRLQSLSICRKNNFFYSGVVSAIVTNIRVQRTKTYCFNIIVLRRLMINI